jgi:predicted HicB family RNase H-like nuclease
VGGSKEQPEVKETESGRTIIVRLSPLTHKALRIRVAEEDTSIQKWVEALIERELGIEKKEES